MTGQDIKDWLDDHGEFVGPGGGGHVYEFPSLEAATHAVNMFSESIKPWNYVPWDYREPSICGHRVVVTYGRKE